MKRRPQSRMVMFALLDKLHKRLDEERGEREKWVCPGCMRAGSDHGEWVRENVIRHEIWSNDKQWHCYECWEANGEEHAR